MSLTTAVAKVKALANKYRSKTILSVTDRITFQTEITSIIQEASAPLDGSNLTVAGFIETATNLATLLHSLHHQSQQTPQGLPSAILKLLPSTISFHSLNAWDQAKTIMLKEIMLDCLCDRSTRSLACVIFAFLDPNKAIKDQTAMARSCTNEREMLDIMLDKLAYRAGVLLFEVLDKWINGGKPNTFKLHKIGLCLQVMHAIYDGYSRKLSLQQIQKNISDIRSQVALHIKNAKLSNYDESSTRSLLDRLLSTTMTANRQAITTIFSRPGGQNGQEQQSTELATLSYSQSINPRHLCYSERMKILEFLKTIANTERLFQDGSFPYLPWQQQYEAIDRILTENQRYQLYIIDQEFKGQVGAALRPR